MGREKVGIIGGGISGVTSAIKFTQLGFDVVVFEKNSKPGGVWNLYYEGLHVQNTREEYYLSDFPWPSPPSHHPSAHEISSYLSQAVAKFSLDVRSNHDVISLEELPAGWRVAYRKRASGEEGHVDVDYVIIATGQFSERKNRPVFPGEERFKGQVMLEREMTSLDKFNGRKVLVVGNGKSALDMATFSGERANHTTQLVRTLHWALPENLYGLHFSYPVFTRFGSSLTPSWVHPTVLGSFIHSFLPFLVTAFWALFQFLATCHRAAAAAPGDRESRARLDGLHPMKPVHKDLRVSLALLPEKYFPLIGQGKIIPVVGEIKEFQENGVVTQKGESIPCDLVVLCLGNLPCSFPFLPQKYREMLEKPKTQLYRHLVHPRIPRMGFAGFNHGFLHYTGIELGSIWLAAVFRGDLLLPSPVAMETTCQRVIAWKAEHISEENCLAFATSTRFQQYHDIIMRDLGLSPYRKFPNLVAEVFGKYGPMDYKGVHLEYLESRKKATKPLNVTDYDT